LVLDVEIVLVDVRPDVLERHLALRLEGQENVLVEVTDEGLAELRREARQLVDVVLESGQVGRVDADPGAARRRGHGEAGGRRGADALVEGEVRGDVDAAGLAAPVNVAVEAEVEAGADLV